MIKNMRLSTHLLIGIFSAFIIIIMLSVNAQATPVTFSGSGTSVVSGSMLSASATFDFVGGNLQITLTNISLNDVLFQADLLSAVFFDIQGNPTLSSVSAVIAPGSTVLFGGTDPGGVVGGEWAYGAGLAGAPNGATQGISSAGLGIFGSATFPGTNLQGPPSGAVDGDQYGITSAGDNPLTGQANVIGGLALIKNSVIFNLSALPVNFDTSKISNVYFQYGSAIDSVHTGFDADVPEGPVPEPGTLLLLGTGLAGLAMWRRIKKA